jgi:hypothetical protein
MRHLFRATPFHDVLFDEMYRRAIDKAAFVLPFREARLRKLTAVLRSFAIRRDLQRTTDKHETGMIILASSVPRKGYVAILELSMSEKVSDS